MRTSFVFEGFARSDRRNNLGEVVYCTDTIDELWNCESLLLLLFARELRKNLALCRMRLLYVQRAVLFPRSFQRERAGGACNTFFFFFFLLLPARKFYTSRDFIILFVRFANTVMMWRFLVASERVGSAYMRKSQKSSTYLHPKMFKIFLKAHLRDKVFLIW